jgi:hypothetical protein
VAKLSQLPEGVAYFVIHGMVSNNLGQSVLSDFFVVPMRIDGGLQGKPLPFEDFLKAQQLDKELFTESITDNDLARLHNSSRYFKDLTSLNGDAYLKILAVFYH